MVKSQNFNRGGQSIICLHFITVILLIGIMIVSVIPFSVIQSHAAATFEKATSSTVIDSKYSFSPRYIQGVTTFEPFGGYSYDEDLYLFNSVKDNKVTLDLINNGSGSAIFTNTITNYNVFSHSDSIYNEFVLRIH